MRHFLPKFLCFSTTRIEKDKAPSSPYLTISAGGDVEYRNDQVLVSTCRMHIYKFPFDTQRCNLSFASAAHSGDQHASSQFQPKLSLTCVRSFLVSRSQTHAAAGQRQLLGGHRGVPGGDEDPVRVALHAHDRDQPQRHRPRGPGHHRLLCEQHQTSWGALRAPYASREGLEKFLQQKIGVSNQTILLFNKIISLDVDSQNIFFSVIHMSLTVKVTSEMKRVTVPKTCNPMKILGLY